MRFYQKIILLLLIGAGSFFVVTNLEELKYETRQMLKAANLITVCDETLYYSVGDVDPRFDITKEEILDSLIKAENVWERDLNKNVFEYRENAEFKINFIFDERQQGTIEKTKLDGQLDELVAHQDNISKEYQEIEANYKKALSAYEKKVKDYENMVEDFNKEVEKWNEKGGAPEDEYEDLKKEEKKIKELRVQLEAERKNINRLVAQMNNLVSKESAVVENYNSKIETYKERFGESREFNQGEYNGTAINIYQFYEKNDLELVLAHELGHALEIEHVENPQSIMYYLMEKQDLENIKLTEEDKRAIKDICKIK